MRYVTYEQFGAKADGVTDDMPAIAAAHAYANEHDLPVRTVADAHYYIGSGKCTAIIQTDTDWGTSRFTIDDRNVEDNKAALFHVVSRHEPLELSIPSLKIGQKNAGVAPGIDCYVVIVENDIRRFIRYGANQNNGSLQTDNFELKADGTIVHELLWDFPRIDKVTALPIDTETLHLRGGYFTTIANEEPSTYNYYARNIIIRRSNVEVMNIHHFVEGEGETGAPYAGFLTISGCARVTVRNCFFTPHKIYVTIGSAGVPVSMGTYDIGIGSATDVLFKDCTQPDILDRTKWGLVGSNFCKNITLDGCIFSRMDAHQGVHTYTIRNTTLGHQGLNAIGCGPLTVENCELYGNAIVSFRGDYGSTWDGDVTVKNVVWHPCQGRECIPTLFQSYNNEQHDYGYECTMPHTITLEDVHVDDSHVPEGYEGMFLWNNYNGGVKPETVDSYEAKFPYKPCGRMIIKNLTCASGKPWQLCQNPLLKPAEEIVEE